MLDTNKVSKAAWEELDRQFKRANEPITLAPLVPPVQAKHVKQKKRHRIADLAAESGASSITEFLAEQKALKQQQLEEKEAAKKALEEEEDSKMHDPEYVKMSALPTDFRFKETTMELARSNHLFWLGDPKVTKQGNQILHYADNWERQQAAYERARAAEEASWGYRIQKLFNLRA